MRRKVRDASGGSPRSFATQKRVVQDDAQFVKAQRSKLRFYGLH